MGAADRLLLLYGVSAVLLNAVDNVAWIRFCHNMDTFEAAISAIFYPVGATAINWLVVAAMHARGHVRPAEHAAPWRGFLVLGAMQTLATVLIVFPDSELPAQFRALVGSLISLPATMTMSRVLLGARYRRGHFLGAAIVTAGAVTGISFGDFAWPTGTHLVMTLCLIAYSFVPQFVWREKLLKQELADGKGPMGVQLVHARTMVCQLFFSVFALPLAFVHLPGRSNVYLSSFGSYLEDAFKCFVGAGPGPSGYCEEDYDMTTWGLYLVYLALNVAMNVANCLLARHGSAVIQANAGNLVTPVKLVLFQVPVLAGAAIDEPFTTVAGVAFVIILLGNAVYVQAPEYSEQPVRLLSADDTGRYCSSSVHAPAAFAGGAARSASASAWLNAPVGRHADPEGYVSLRSYSVNPI